MTRRAPTPRLIRRLAAWLTWPRTLALIWGSYMLVMLSPVLPDWLRAVVPLSLAAGAVAWALRMSRSHSPAPAPDNPGRLDRLDDWVNRHTPGVIWGMLAWALVYAALEHAQPDSLLSQGVRLSGLIVAGLLAMLIARRRQRADDE